MKQYVYEADIQQLSAGLLALGIPLAANVSPDFTCSLTCHLYRNPDGSLRWLWPAGAGQPDFLRFYHRGSTRARLFVWLVRLAFRLNRGRWVAQDELTLYTTARGYGRFRQAQVDRWALFTGTTGPNRKLVLWYSTLRHNSHFVKIALAQPAQENLRQEARALQYAQREPFGQLISPRLDAYAPGILVQEDLGNNTRRPNAFADLPAGDLQELLGRNWHTVPLQQTSFWTQARQSVAHLRSTPDARISSHFVDKLDWLMASLPVQQLVPVAVAHGDFTPWNLLLQGNQLCVVDWELYRAELPGLYDLFHFHYQSLTLIGNRGYGAVRQALDATLRQPHWQSFTATHRVDTGLAEVLYLIHTLPYYLSVYSRQPRWHQQVNWLLSTWNDALTYWLGQRKAVSDRTLVLYDLSIWLHKHPYAALKFLPAQLHALPDSSDLDLCMPRSVAGPLTRQLRQHGSVSQLVVESRSFMKQLHIRCRDNSVLHLDLIWSFKRKQLEFMSADAVWGKATRGPHGLNIPDADSERAYIRLFYGLNNAGVPDRYRALFDEPVGPLSGIDLRPEIGQLPQNRGWRGLLNTVAYACDTLRSFAFRPGMVVTFSGVDGAGKSTVIEQTKYQIEKNLRQRVVVLRHRPSLLPILSAWKYGRQQAEQRSVASLPRQGTNQSRLSSLVRFGYYFADYLLGQFYIQAKYVWRGYIVLYDRYYFDFINDSRRSNLQLPPGLAARLYRLLLKPRLNIFLHAPAEDILRRKQELDAATITELTGQYFHLFEQLQRRYPASEYMTVLNQDLEQTLTRIVGRITNYSS